MSEPTNAWSDQRIDQILGNLLRTGVILASSVVILGAVFFLVKHGGEEVDLTRFKGEPVDLTSVRGTVADALSGRRAGVIQLGVLLLIATPIARVAFSVFAFAVQRDRTYVTVTLIVLSILLYSLLAG